MPWLWGSVLLATWIFPPSPSVNCFAMKRPMPVPMVVRVVKKASKMWGRLLFRDADAIVADGEQTPGQARGCF